jgi:hypothetical protein
MTTEHPDQLQDYIALKQIRRGSKQAIEDKAIEAYHKALDEGSREEAEKEYFSFFNKKAMTELFAYRIPDRYFAPHKVVKPFYARVAYSIVNDIVKIEEVSLSESAVKFVKMGPQLMADIRATIEAKVKPVVNNKHVNEIVMSAIAPHI